MNVFHFHAGRLIAFLFPVLASCLLLSVPSAAQPPEDRVNESDVQRIEKTLSADDMQGRGSFGPGLAKAAGFISAEFKAAGLQPLNGSHSFLQSFTLVRSTTRSVKAVLDGQPLDSSHIIVLSSATDLQVNNHSGYILRMMRKGDDFRSGIRKYLHPDSNFLVLVDTSFSKIFPRLNGLKRSLFKSPYSTIFLLTPAVPHSYEIRAANQVAEVELSNVAGMIPGTTRKDEYVIFSAHYDHLGVGKPDARGDSVYNGANDDASGCTAVMMLARYFAAMKENARSLIFVTFAAEESGGYGSQYFSRQMDPARVMAMFNIEMIGTESKWGRNSAYLTGFDRSDMGKILQKNLEGTQFRFYPDPYPAQQLFFRSDNATLAAQGVPAHSISTSKMDDEKFYHTPGDEIGTLDMGNMTEIIRAIARSAASIVSGQDTPSRVDTSALK